MQIAKVTYPGVESELYVVTDQGTILNTITMNPLAYYVDRDGYFRVSLKRSDGSYGQYFVAQIVAWQFCNHNDPACTQVDHVNGEKKYNFARNLEWVTPKENTRRAEQVTKVRTVQGEGNGNSRYTEDFVRQICKRYEEGAMPIDIYAEYYGNEPIRYQSQHNFYNFLYRIKKRIAWPNIIKDYNFSTDTKYENSVVKHFKPRVDGKYNEEDVRWICEEIVSGKSNDVIVEELMNGARENFNDYAKERIRDIVSAIRRRSLWSSISADYDFGTGGKFYITTEEYAKVFKELKDKGYSHNQIIEYVSNKYRKSRRHVGRFLNNFETFDQVSGDPIEVVLPS